MNGRCGCTPNTIDGRDINEMPAWELVLRNAAHGHYPAPELVLQDAVLEIDRLRRALDSRRTA